MDLLELCWGRFQDDPCGIQDPREVLITAARQGNVATMRRLLRDHGLDANYVNPEGMTPLHTAARYGHVEMVKYLVNNGKATVDASNHTGETALFAAVRGNSEPIVRFLLQHGANLNRKNQHDNTCLHIAAQFGYVSIAKCLVESGARAMARNRLGESPLSLATVCQNEEIEALLQSHEAS